MTTLPRIFGPFLLTASLVMLGVSSWGMAQKLSHRPELKERPRYWFKDRLSAERFDFLGIPGEVVMALDPPDADSKASRPEAVIIKWRGQEARFDIGGREEPRLPGLLRHEDWFKLLPMIEGRADKQEEIERRMAKGEIKPRLIAAARYPAEGFDQQTWGLVRRREWRYKFVELLPDAPVDQCIRTWETTYGQIERVVAPGPHDKPVEGLTDEQRRDLAWQYDAMIQITPSTLFRAKDKIVQQGMDAMSWTWPVAGVSVLGIMIGAMMTMSSHVSKPKASLAPRA